MGAEKSHGYFLRSSIKTSSPETRSSSAKRRASKANQCKITKRSIPDLRNPEVDEDPSFACYLATLLSCLLAVPVLWLLARWLLMGGAEDASAAASCYLSALLARLTWWWCWRPLACGFGVSVLSGILVYWDSADPGENPRSPLSSRNSLFRGGGGGGVTCHLAYLVAIINGVAASVLYSLVKAYE